MMTEVNGACWNCGIGLQKSDYGRQDFCPQCGKDTRVCKACYFYDPALNNACREPQGDRVVDKEKSNFCDYFKPRSMGQGLSAELKYSRDSIQAAAENLFKKK